MRREVIQGALVTIILMLGLSILRSRNAGETARLMIYAAHQARAWSSGAIARDVPRSKGKRRARLHMLQGLAGVCPERAKRLRDEFGSVESVLTASMEDLRAVDGIGLTTAEAIRWVMSEKQTHYGCADLSSNVQNVSGRFIGSDYSS